MDPDGQGLVSFDDHFGQSSQDDSGVLSFFIRKVKSALSTSASASSELQSLQKSQSENQTSVELEVERNVANAETKSHSTLSNASASVVGSKKTSNQKRKSDSSSAFRSLNALDVLDFVGLRRKLSVSETQSGKPPSNVQTIPKPSKLSSQVRPSNVSIFISDFEPLEKRLNLSSNLNEQRVKVKHTRKTSLPARVDAWDSEKMSRDRRRSNSHSLLSSPAAYGDSLSHSFMQKLKHVTGSEGPGREFWLRDEISKECYKCKLFFTTFRRRHHCRVCGQVFCSKCCSDVIPGHLLGYKNDIRVCDYCAKYLQTERQASQLAESLVDAPLPLSYPSAPSSPSIKRQLWKSQRPHVTLSETHLSNTATVHSQSPSTHGSSFNHVRRIFTSPNLFVPRFWSSSSLVVTSAPQSKIPFRPDMDEEESDMPSTSTAEQKEETTFVQFLSQSQLGSRSPNPRRLSLNVEPSRELKRPSSVGPELPYRGLKERRNTISSTKYSAKSLRDKLNVITDATASPNRDNDENFENSPGKPDSETKIDESRDRNRTVSGASSKHRRSRVVTQGIIVMSDTSLDYLRNLLEHILQEYDIDQKQLWAKVIMSLLNQIDPRLGLDVRNSGSMDIRQYIKIKKIPGGKPTECQVIPGVVFTKNVAHKKMCQLLHNPRIMLLTFALEYEREENHYISLDPILQQEHEYSRNMVNKILSLHPNIILVGSTVSRVMLELLLEANIVVIINAKQSVIEEVARSTSADIIRSIDRVTLRNDVKLGACGKFYIKSYQKKTYLYFDDCVDNTGGTILLHGCTVDELSKVKQIIDFMIFALYNAKLESYLVNDLFAYIGQLDPETKETSSGGCMWRFLTPYKNTTLSVTPGINFGAPFVLQRMQKFEADTLDGKEKMKLSSKASSEIEEENNKNLYCREKEIEEAFTKTSSYLSVGLSGLKVNEGWAVELRDGIHYLVENVSSVISPLFHQNLILLYCNVCTVTSSPCHSPQVHVIEYYKRSDMTLGQYLEELCFDSNYLCPADSCHRPIIMHIRSYLHGSARLNVLVEEFPCPIPGMENRILMWNYCKECKVVTPVLPMSDESWKFSFGKFLEWCFYHENVLSRSNSCEHRITREYVRYFGLKDLAVRFEYETIQLNECISPALRTHILAQTLVDMKSRDFQDLKEQIKAFYESLAERVSKSTFASQTSEMTLELQGIMQKVSAEKISMLKVAQERYQNSLETNVIVLNRVRKILFQNCIAWDQTFTDFAKKYLLNEKLDKKPGATNLRKFFMDSDFAKFSNIYQQNFEPETSNDKQRMVDYYDANEMPAFLTTTSELDKWSNSAMVEELILPNIEKETFNKDPDSMKMRSAVEMANIRVEQSDADVSPLNSSGLGMNQAQRCQSDPRHTESTIVALLSPTSPAKTSTEDKNDLSLKQKPTAVESSEKEGERLSVMKTLKELWAGNNSDIQMSLIGGETSLLNEFVGYKPLRYPFSSNEHIMGESDIIIREQEPGSIVAYSLSSSHYLNFIKGKRDHHQASVHAEARAYRKSMGASTHNSSLDAEPEFSKDRKSIASSLSSNWPTSGIVIEPEESTSENMEKAQENMFEPSSTTEDMLLKGDSTHLNYEFAAGPAQCTCKVYFAEQFDALRNKCKSEGQYAVSLSRNIRWSTGGGQSKSAFYKTADDRYVIKQLSKSEMDAFLRFALPYFEYMSQCLFHGLPTLLAKISGLYRVTYRNPATGRNMKIDLIVMENLFYDRRITRIFDLKGSMRNRRTTLASGQIGEVLLDDNLRELITESPLFIREHSKKCIRASVWNDTLFLSKLNVMDYSLLVGIDEERHELVIGIVDFIRTFTWDKKLENWVKESGILGGGGQQPTILSPRQYKTRFREAMETYFLMVPDKFCDIKSVRI